MNDILPLTEIEKKGVCQCRSCSGIFNQSEIKRIQIEQLGQTAITSTCPHCGSTNFGLIDPIVDEEYNTYKSKKFYGIGYKYNVKGW